MLIELFILLMVVTFIIFIFNFMQREVLFWGVCIILFGVLSLSAISVESIEPFYNLTSGSYYMSTYYHIDYPMIGINGLFFALSILLFFYDAFDQFGKQFWKDFKFMKGKGL